MNDLVIALEKIAELEELGHADRLLFLADQLARAAKDTRRTHAQRCDLKTLANACHDAARRAKANLRSDAAKAARRLTR